MGRKEDLPHYEFLGPKNQKIVQRVPSTELSTENKIDCALKLEQVTSRLVL